MPESEAKFDDLWQKMVQEVMVQWKAKWDAQNGNTNAVSEPLEFLQELHFGILQKLLVQHTLDRDAILLRNGWFPLGHLTKKNCEIVRLINH